MQDFIKTSSSKASPWLAYYALTEAHTPLIVEEQFKGKSSHGAYGDTILQMDHLVGRVLDTLRDTGAPYRLCAIDKTSESPYKAKKELFIV